MRAIRSTGPLLLPLCLLVTACPDGQTTGNGESDGGRIILTGSSSSSSSTGGAGSSSSSGGVGSSSSTSSGGTSSSASGSTGSGSGSGSTSATASSSSSASSTSSSSSSSGVVEPPAYVFAHSQDTLFRLDAEALTRTTLGQFDFRDENDGTLDAAMTDLAVDAEGFMFGVGQVYENPTTYALFRIESPTWRAVRIAELTENFVGLTFVPIGVLSPTEERLVGATRSDGALYEIDITDGTTSYLGAYGGGWVTSGDIVAIANDGMYATVKDEAELPDYLARIDTTTWQATIIGNGIGTERTWGLGYWGGTLYAFNRDGKIFAIDRTTGLGSQIQVDATVEYWGAGVTTLAKTTPDN
ncbi:MAG: hypothetical protein AB2A00_18875 [Myxococcota bacterium]